MPRASGIGQLPVSVETVIAGVRRQLDDDCSLGRFSSCAPQELDRVASETVQDMWPTSRVKVFLPILALRRARERLQLAGGAQP